MKNKLMQEIYNEIKIKAQKLSETEEYKDANADRIILDSSIETLVSLVADIILNQKKDQCQDIDDFEIDEKALDNLLEWSKRKEILKNEQEIKTK